MATKHRPSRPSVPARKHTAKPAVKAHKPIKAAAKRSPKPSKASGPAKGARPAAKASRPAAKASHPTAKAAPRRAAAATTAKRGRPESAPAPVKTTPVIPSGPSSHDLAVETFERGFRSLQERKFREAARLLGSIIDSSPDEKELHERARVFLAICERQAVAERDRTPHTLEERLNAATVALNRGDFGEALGYLRSVEREDRENDLAFYMMAVALTGLGDGRAAVPCLQQAVALNPENRYLAMQDADLHPLRELPEFASLLEPPPAPRRRATTRERSGR
jgi:tetratricopeptide (TPR) repeat protein